MYLDTHVVAWLYGGATQLIPADVQERLETEDELRISPMVRLELQYLFEIGRVRRPGREVIDAVESALDVAVCRAPFAAVVREGERHTWTRDPFDRFITAQAALFEAPLLTRDAGILGHYRHACWSATGDAV